MRKKKLQPVSVSHTVLSRAMLARWRAHPIEVIETVLFDPETGQPFKLFHGRLCLRAARSCRRGAYRWAAAFQFGDRRGHHRPTDGAGGSGLAPADDG